MALSGRFLSRDGSAPGSRGCGQGRAAQRPVAAFICALLLSAVVLHAPAVLAGPIFPEQARKERNIHNWPVEQKVLSVFTKNPAKKIAPALEVDLEDGLNALEAPMLAAVINPRAWELRKKKKLTVPQIMEAGLISPPSVFRSKPRLLWAESWLPRKQTKAFKAVAVEFSKRKGSAKKIELETAWLEWQASQAARLYFYKRLYSRKIIDTLREIRNAYKEIYRSAGWPVYQGKYEDKRIKARTGYRHIKKYIMDEQKELSKARVELDHALGLPTNLQVPLQKEIDFKFPARIPTAPELIDGLGKRRIDLMALQEGIVDKDPERMGYIFSRFEDVVTFVGDRKKSEWLNTKRSGVVIDLPLFSRATEEAPLQASDGQKLFEEYKRRIGYAKKDLPLLVNGINILLDEITKVDLTLPALQSEADEAARGKDSVIGYEKIKSVLAVKLLRLRLMKKLIEATVALELASGKKISMDVPLAEAGPLYKEGAAGKAEPAGKTGPAKGAGPPGPEGQAAPAK